MDNKTALINPQNILEASDTNFETLALGLFHYQYHNNILYRQFCEALKIDPGAINTITQIPFLPISFFKSHDVTTGNWTTPELVFESSGTTGEVPSRHLVKDAGMYEQSLMNGFTQFYGPVNQYVFLALLPSYLERRNASLVHMAKTLMAHSPRPENGFYINEWQLLYEQITKLAHSHQTVLLLGVTFALLDFAQAYPGPLKNIIVMETGGMKGRREEWTRDQVHNFLKQQWAIPHIHSEYGMTELLSQAYAKANGIFECTNTMRVLVRDINDPLDVSRSGAGALNIIDLANIYSCSFIATEDLGKVNPNGSFEVLGRLDHSALRGCSLMAL